MDKAMKKTRGRKKLAGAAAISLAAALVLPLAGCAVPAGGANRDPFPAQPEAPVPDMRVQPPALVQPPAPGQDQERTAPNQSVEDAAGNALPGCPGYTDADNNGICDNQSASAGKGGGCFAPGGPDSGTCPGKGPGQGRGSGRG